MIKTDGIGKKTAAKAAATLPSTIQFKRLMNNDSIFYTQTHSIILQIYHSYIEIKGLRHTVYVKGKKNDDGWRQFVEHCHRNENVWRHLYSKQAIT